MRIVAGFNEVPPVEVIVPHQQSVPFVFNSPHSGKCYPKSFVAASRLDSHAIRRSEDAFVDYLFEDVVSHGAPLIRANFPRAFLDVNREPYELDPKMFNGRLPSYANTRSLRVAGGLGTIARVVGESQEIYRNRLDVSDGLHRIEKLYKPFHQTIRRTLARTHVTFGHAILIDCHSMPSTVRGHDIRTRPDFILGDRYGTSCMPTLTRVAEEFLAERGYSVSRNKPYAGGFITEHYGRPARGLHAMQIEINRGLYMDEVEICLSENASQLKTDLTELSRHLLTLPDYIFSTESIAAE
ncbi:MAG: N-formylglutamate amidohydrolase [Stappiaceae bacterium]